MIDRDLAELYGVDSKQLKRQVRRNLERFPDDFMFEMSKIELKLGGRKLRPPIQIKKDYGMHLDFC